MSFDQIFSSQGSDNKIHPSVVVTGDVVLGSRNYIGPGTILVGPLVLGDDNWIAAAAIGFPPEHTEWYEGARDHGVGVKLGSRVIVREYVTIHSGFEKETVIEDGCFLMTKTHVGHDAVLCKDVVSSPATMIGGHAVVGTQSVLGMNSVIHQRLTVGSGVMIGMNSTVTHDIPDFALAYGNPARVHGANKVCLHRMGWTQEQIAQKAQDLSRSEV